MRGLKKDSEELTKRFRKTYKFCDKDINKLILLLRKGVYPYEYMDLMKYHCVIKKLFIVA